jgi:hypothetical protein
MATPGQPTSYKPEYCELAHNYCLLGATNEVLGDFFGVTSRTIDNWIATRNRQRQYWQAKAEAAPEIANDDLAAALDAAGESMRHAGD